MVSGVDFTTHHSIHRPGIVQPASSSFLRPQRRPAIQRDPSGLGPPTMIYRLFVGLFVGGEGEECQAGNIGGMSAVNVERSALLLRRIEPDPPTCSSFSRGDSSSEAVFEDGAFLL